jgi:hypothetical protein
MKKQIIVSALLCLIIANTNTQQALWSSANIISPEINSDNSVTFRLLASNTKDVKISGDWMPSQVWTPGNAPMKNDDSVFALL